MGENCEVTTKVNVEWPKTLKECQNKVEKIVKKPGCILISLYLRAQPRRQIELETSPTRNPFPVQAKKREIPGIEKKKVSQSIQVSLHFMVFSLFNEFPKCSISTLEIGKQ